MFENSSCNFQAFVNNFGLILCNAAKGKTVMITNGFTKQLLANHYDGNDNCVIFITYFSLPASLEAYLEYQTATLNPIDTNSNTASCWAL